MKFLKFSFIALLFVLLNSCVSSIPVNNNFYSNGNKMGIIVYIEYIALTQVGSRGLLDLALTPGNRFKAPLDSIAPSFDFRDRIKSEVAVLMEKRGKNFEFLPDDIDLKTVERYKAPEKSKLKYSKMDLRSFKEKYGVKEIMIVDVKYGLAVGYYGMIETGKDGFSMIYTEFVNLDNNSLLGRNTFQSMGKMKGNWKKDDYINLKKAINDAMNESIRFMKVTY